MESAAIMLVFRSSWAQMGLKRLSKLKLTDSEKVDFAKSVDAVKSRLRPWDKLASSGILRPWPELSERFQPQELALTCSPQPFYKWSPSSVIELH